MRRFDSMDRRTMTIVGLVLAVVLFVALNTFGSLSLRGMKVDLTQNHQFTLSQGTIDLLHSVEEPITVRLYVSKAIRENNPFLATYADRVHDTLQTYASASNGRIEVEYIDPEPFSPEEDRAVGFGLEPITLDASGTSAYFGIAASNSTDDVDVIPVLSPEREQFLEYDLTRMVYNLSHPEKPVVAMISGLPVNGDPANQYRPWQVYDQLSQFFDIRYIGGDIDKFDQDVKLLFLVHPQGLSDKTLFAIDQFVLGGGKAMVFVDPHSEAGAARQRTPQPAAASSNLEKLFASWGVAFDPSHIVADPAYARQVQFPSGGRQQVVDYLAWLSLDKSALDSSSVITAELDRLNMASAGSLKPADGATTTFERLVQSSDKAQLVETERVALYPDPLALIRDYKAGGERLTLAARVTGPVKSAFAGDLPDGISVPENRLTESKDGISVIVVADTDLLDDRSWLLSQNLMGQSVALPVADNANFVANGMDALAGSEALAGLRGREVTMRPFTKVAEIRRNAEQAYRAKEQELLGRLKDLQGKLSSLQVSGGDDTALLTNEQRDEIEGFRSQLLQTRQELREVQHALRQDIEQLRDNVRLGNIVLMPLLIGILGIVVAVVKHVRFRRRYDATA